MSGENETLGTPLLAAPENLERTYFEVLGLCCSSEVALIENILKPLEGVKEVYVIVPSKTVIVVHDSLRISSLQIVNALNKARLEANVKVEGDTKNKKKWPSPSVIVCGLLLAVSFFKYLYEPLQWVALVSVAVCVLPIFLKAIAAIRNFTIDVNILMLIAVVGTLSLGDFLDAGTIVFLFTIAQWLESKASHEANAVMSSLMSLAPQKAVIAETGESVDVQDVQLDTILAVKAGEAIPLDGIVAEGNAEVDEKMLTGESFPVNKEKDSTVMAGAIVLNGYLSVKTTALAENCVVARMAKLVEEAQNRKSKTQRLIDECSKFYTPTIVLISACVAAVPAALNAPNESYWFHLALVVLMSACPCGLILSTPVATFCAMSKAATIGLLFKGGDYLEILAKAKVVAFDKTGTITKGELLLTDFSSFSDDVSVKMLLYWVSSIESRSSHPIAAAVADYADSLSIKPRPENVQDFKNFPGQGICGKIDGQNIFVGNKRFGQRAGFLTSRDTEDPKRDGRSTGYIYSRGSLIGSFCISDTCRLGAVEAIEDLNSRGITTVLLTGDSQAAAMYTQNELRQALAVVCAELLPEEKATIIQEFKKSGPTAMVGDGVNDAPALATADIGISMGVSGSALATETGHVIQMSNDIRKIPKAIQLAQQTRRKVFENLIFSIAVKAGVIALAFAGYPLVWVAVLADVLTCLLVIGNSMLLLSGSYMDGPNQKCQRSAAPGNVAVCKSSTCCSKSMKVKDASEQSQACCGIQQKECCPQSNQKKCANTTPKFKSSKCASRKCTTYSESLKCKDAVKKCKSAKCVSKKCTSSSESTKCKDTVEKCSGRDKQPKQCCSQNICAVKLEQSSQEITDDKNGVQNKTCIITVERHPKEDCCKAVSCNENSCCSNDVVSRGNVIERQGNSEAERRCCHSGKCNTVDNELETGDPSCHSEGLQFPSASSSSMTIPATNDEAIEGGGQTSTCCMVGSKDGSDRQSHCSRVHSQADNLTSQGDIDVNTMFRNACDCMGMRDPGACCRSLSRSDCCAQAKCSPACGGSLAEIVIQ